MRKVYLMALMLFVAASTQAQRTIDWSVDEILRPTSVSSETGVGTKFDMSFVVKNNGTDAVKADDSMTIQVRFIEPSQNRLVWGYPMVQNGGNYVLATAYRQVGKAMNSGDTAHVNVSFTSPFITNNSLNMTLAAVSTLFNRSADSVRTETDFTNNVKTSSIVWYNTKGWGVSVEEISNNSQVTIFPNPATDELNVKWSIGQVDANSTVRVLDLSGRVIIEEATSSIAFGHKLDIAKLENGIYIVEIKNGDNVVTQKLQVNK